MKSSPIKAIALRLSPNEDIKTSLDKYVLENDIPAACIIACVGSLAKVNIRFAGAAESKLVNGPFEILSLSGTLSTTGSHLHISLSDIDGNVFGGHLKENSPVYSTAEVVIGVLTDISFQRITDPRTGWKELFLS